MRTIFFGCTGANVGGWGQDHLVDIKDAGDLDLFAWNAILGWAEAAGFETTYNAIDYGELTRWFLWDKVGRAVRSVTNPGSFVFEEKTLVGRQDIPGRLGRWKRNALHAAPEWVKEKIRKKSEQHFLANVTQLKNENNLPSVHIPYASNRLSSLATLLIEQGIPLSVSGLNRSDSYANSHFLSPLKSGAFKEDIFANRLYEAIYEGLRSQGIKLLPYDLRLLRNQIVKQIQLIEKAETELSLLKPMALLMHGDNHSPYQEYVAVANNLGIPTITVQHGLDCERYYLDDVYAKVIAVWGEVRKRRYEESSSKSPSLLAVTGNPGYDQITSTPERLDDNGEYVLWITRPHNSKYCYAPSRSPEEGMSILHTLLQFLASNSSEKLVIKPHPGDYTDFYQESIDSNNLADRARLSDGELGHLVKNAKFVVSEDSTGGLDAMLQGKVLIHAHFAPSDAVLPFHQYGAALTGYSEEDLLGSLEFVNQLSESDRQEMLEGQKRFIKDFAGELDGRSSMRFVAMVKQVLEECA